MNGAIEAAEDNPMKRTAFFFAMVSVGLFGLLLGGWLTPGLNVVSVADPVALTALGSTDQPTPISETPLPVSGFSLVSVALFLAAVLMMVASFALLWQVRRLKVDNGTRDPATGLYRKAYVDEAVSNQMARDDRSGRSQLAVVRIQIDYLDAIERRYGAQAVETLIEYAGRQLRGQTREGDLPVREHDGGDFTVYLQCEELSQAEAFCRRLSMMLSREQMEFRGDIVKITASMGIVLREPGEALADLRDRAGSRLAEVKRNGSDVRIVS